MQDKRGRSTNAKAYAESEQFGRPRLLVFPAEPQDRLCLSPILFSISQRIVSSGIDSFLIFSRSSHTAGRSSRCHRCRQIPARHPSRTCSYCASSFPIPRPVNMGYFVPKPQRSSRRPLAVDRRNRLQIHRTRFPLPSFLHGHHAPIRNRIVRPPLSHASYKNRPQIMYCR